MRHRYDRAELSDLVAVLALDAIDRDERDDLEAGIVADVELRRELDAHRAVAACLAEAVESVPSTPSPEVWRRIAAEIDGHHQPPRLAPVVALRRQRMWSMAAAAISVAAVAVSVALGARVVSLQNRIEEPDLQRLAAEKMTEPGAAVVTLVGQEGYESASARIVLGADGLGYLLADELAPLPADRTYQLWAIVAGAPGEPDRVVSAGVLGSDPGVSQFQAVGEVGGFAITDEVVGGVPVSEGPTVAAWLDEA